MSGMEKASTDYLKRIDILEPILEHLDDSNDISNLFRAVPELCSLSKGHQFSWLIAEVMPLIFPKYINTQGMFTCRYVSMRWRNAINSAIEAHPDHLPYKSPKLSVIKETDFSYHKLPYLFTNLQRFLDSEYFRQNHPKLSPRLQNPFPGRSVGINVKRRGDRYYDSLNAKYTELSDALPVLQKLGHHIWYIHFELPSTYYLSEEMLIGQVIKPMFLCLSCLPNLKSLKISTTKEYPGNRNERRGERDLLKFIASRTCPFHLESLDMSEFDDHRSTKQIQKSLIRAFVNRYHVMQFKLQSVCLWSKLYNNLFPNICELQVGIFDRLLLQKQALKVMFSQIRKLTLKTSWVVSVTEILRVLMPYQVESLVIVGLIEDDTIRRVDKVSSQHKMSISSHLASLFMKNVSSVKSSGVETGEGITVPSIRSLKLEATPYLSFDFLKFLPSLEHLTIEIGANMMDRPRMSATHSFTSDNIFRSCLHEFYFRDGHDDYDFFKPIWDFLPYLEMLRVNSFHYISHCYTRECRDKAFFSHHVEASCLPNVSVVVREVIGNLHPVSPGLAL